MPGFASKLIALPRPHRATHWDGTAGSEEKPVSYRQPLAGLTHLSTVKLMSALCRAASLPIITGHVLSHRCLAAALRSVRGCIPAHNHRSCVVAPVPRCSPALCAGLHPCPSSPLRGAWGGSRCVGGGSTGSGRQSPTFSSHHSSGWDTGTCATRCPVYPRVNPMINTFPSVLSWGLETLQ